MSLRIMSLPSIPDEEATRGECSDCGYRKECWILPSYRGITLYYICCLSGKRVASTETCPRDSRRISRTQGERK